MTVTVAPGSTALLVSVTLPLSCAVEIWPNAGSARRRSTHVPPNTFLTDWFMVARNIHSAPNVEGVPNYAGPQASRITRINRGHRRRGRGDAQRSSFVEHGIQRGQTAGTPGHHLEGRARQPARVDLDRRQRRRWRRPEVGDRGRPSQRPDPQWHYEGLPEDRRRAHRPRLRRAR